MFKAVQNFAAWSQSNNTSIPFNCNKLFNSKIMSNNNDKCLHIAMYPWLAFGHLTSFLHLANKLAKRGHKISFLLPTKAQHKLASYNHHPDLITFIPISVPQVDGLPTGAETTSDVPAAAHPKLMVAMDLTQDTIDCHLGQLKPDYVFFDLAEWLPALARKHGAKSLLHFTTNISSIAYFCLQARNLPLNHHITEGDLVDPPPGFPLPAMRLRANEARALAYGCNMDFGKGMSMIERQSISYEQCDTFAIKSCKEMEGAYYDFLQKHFEKPILLVGPMLPEPPITKLDDHFDSWLNGFNHGSVVYCALGSEWFLEKNQFQELVLGLELTGMPFLAALRPPKGCDTIKSALPEGYLRRTEGRGIVHGGWVQQQLILQHPSVGCFVTHCGVGSLSEAMLRECQLVMLPQAVDQSMNARLMSLEFRVGVEVEMGEDDGFFTRDAVQNAVKMVMDQESEVAKEVRTNHTKWRNILLRQGLEDSYINGFVQSLRDLLG